MMIESNISLQTGTAKFLAFLVGQNKSGRTVQAYTTDLLQFVTFLEENYLLNSPADVTRTQISEYLTYLSQERDLSGVTRARKLAAIREYFRFLLTENYLLMSPAEKLPTPKQERRTRGRLRQDEYDRLLAHAGAKPRDFAILTVCTRPYESPGICAIRSGKERRVSATNWNGAIAALQGNRPRCGSPQGTGILPSVTAQIPEDSYGQVHCMRS